MHVTTQDEIPLKWFAFQAKHQAYTPAGMQWKTYILIWTYNNKDQPSPFPALIDAVTAIDSASTSAEKPNKVVARGAWTAKPRVLNHEECIYSILC